MLLSQGYVSRNYYINLPYDRILRLGAIINLLREENWDIETDENDVDCVYRLKKANVITVKYRLPDGREIVTYRK